MTAETSLYGGKYKCVFSEAAHRYKINGEAKQGVTSVLKLLAKDNLIQWAANMVCEYIKINCSDQGEYYEVFKEDLKLAKYAHIRKRDSSADTGKLVHKWIEDHIQGNDTEITAAMQPSVDAFLKWELENKPEYIHSEKVVYSEKYDYCGTADIIFTMNGKTYVGDFKTGDPDKEWDRKLSRPTGRTRARTEALLQNAAYDQAYSEEYGVNADAYMVIYCTKENGLYFYEADYTKILRLAWVTIFNMHKLLGKINQLNEFN